MGKFNPTVESLSDHTSPPNTHLLCVYTLIGGLGAALAAFMAPWSDFANFFSPPLIRNPR